MTDGDAKSSVENNNCEVDKCGVENNNFEVDKNVAAAGDDLTEFFDGDDADFANLNY